MLFNRGFDLSLYLIMISDKKNKELIVSLIKMIPEEFYVYLRNEISKLEMNYNCRCSFQSKNYFLSDGFMYTINSGINSSKLELVLYRRDFNGNIEEKYDLSLLYFDDNSVLERTNDSFEFGEFSYDLIEYSIDKYNCKRKIVKNSYIVKKNRFNKLYIYSKNDIFKFGNLIDLNNIPSNLNLVEFNKDSLIKKRRHC